MSEQIEREQRLADPGPTARMMSTNAHEELYKLLLDTAEECPLEVLANCVEVMTTVMNRRLHDLPIPVEDMISTIIEGGICG